LLIKDTINNEGYGRRDSDNKHQCYALTNFKEGGLMNMDHLPIFDSNPSNVEGFIGRQQEMYDIINLMEEHRLVSILGPPGIGKTSIARNLANYIKDRKKFSEGIIYVPLRGCESAQMFLTRLTLIIRASCTIEEYKKYGLEDLDK
jgi:Mrp family chromosome partitioning ATPase